MHHCLLQGGRVMVSSVCHPPAKLWATYRFLLLLGCLAFSTGRTLMGRPEGEGVQSVGPCMAAILATICSVHRHCVAEEGMLGLLWAGHQLTWLLKVYSVVHTIRSAHFVLLPQDLPYASSPHSLVYSLSRTLFPSLWSSNLPLPTSLNFYPCLSLQSGQSRALLMLSLGEDVPSPLVSQATSRWVCGVTAVHLVSNDILYSPFWEPMT